MNNTLYQLPNNCIKYRIVEFEYFNAVTQWARANMHLGADIWTDFSNHTAWVIVPESLLFKFLEQYGHAVSA